MEPTKKTYNISFSLNWLGLMLFAIIITQCTPIGDYISAQAEALQCKESPSK
jgi:hypothetical protein